MPLPATRAIHPAWGAYTAPTATRGMNATIRLTRADADARNDSAGWSPKHHTPGAPPSAAAASDATLIYDGPAYLEAIPSRAVTGADVAGQDITIRSYRLALPRSAPRARVGRTAGDRVTITAAPNPAAVGLRLRVIDAAVDPDAGEQDLIAALDLTDNNPPPAPAT